MKNSLNRKFLTSLLFLVMLAALFALPACANQRQSSIQLSVSPQTVYVQGNPLSLSGGSITYDNGSERTEVSLTDEGVTVTGYNPSALGEQQLTVSYMGCTSTFSVTVVPRFRAEGLEVGYYVGDYLNLEKGRLVVTRDDGSSFTLPLNDPNVKLEYDNSAANPASPVSVVYGNGEEEYSGTFTVGFYAPDSVTFTRPLKTAYKSHEQELSLTGGYIAFTSSILSDRYVTLTQDMVSGFSPELATPEQRSTPLRQTITVQYGGRTFSYSIAITYSEVSLMRLRASQLSSLNWSGSTPPQISKEQGEDALDAIAAFLQADKADQALVTEEELQAVARVAAVYGYGQWSDAAESYSQTFIFTGAGLTFNLNGTYAAALEASKAINEHTGPLFTTAATLTALADYMGKTLLFGGATYSSYLAAVFDPSGYDEVSQMLAYMTELYSCLADVPQNWQVNQLADYEEGLNTACALMINSNYSTGDKRAIHAAVSGWRTNNDFFEILYEYYLAAGDDATINSLKQVYLPGPLEEMYSSAYNALMQRSYILGGRTYDSSLFMYYYDKMVNAEREVCQSSNQLYLNLYGKLKFGGFMEEEVTLAVIAEALKTTNYGYEYLRGPLLGEDQFSQFWQEYLNVVQKYLVNGGYSQEFGGDVEALFADFVALSPAQQFGFLYSLHPTYGRSPEYAFDFSAGTFSCFADLLASHYGAVLPSSTQTIFNGLLLSIESYARRHNVNDGMQIFVDKMQQTVKEYILVSAFFEDDAKIFDDKLGFAYNRYVDVYSGFGAPYISPQWTEVLSQIEQAVKMVNVAYSGINSGLHFEMAVIAAYERAEKLALSVRTSAPVTVLNSFCHNQTFSASATSRWTLDYALFYARNIYITVLRGVRQGDGSLWQSYSTSGLQNFMSQAYFVVVPYMLSFSSDSSLDKSYDSEEVLSAIQAFRDLTAEQQSMVAYLNDLGASLTAGDNANNFKLYTCGLNAFFGTLLSPSASAAAQKLFALEQEYVIYAAEPTPQHKAAVKLAYDGFTAAYQGLSSEDAEQFNQYLGETSAYYTQLCADF